MRGVHRLNAKISEVVQKKKANLSVQIHLVLDPPSETSQPYYYREIVDFLQTKYVCQSNVPEQYLS